MRRLVWLRSGTLCPATYGDILSPCRPGPEVTIKTPRYFEEQVSRKRPYLRREWCERVVTNPIRREVQADGRVRFWGQIPGLDNRIVRVVTLADGETVHNALPDGTCSRRS